KAPHRGGANRLHCSALASRVQWEADAPTPGSPSVGASFSIASVQWLSVVALGGLTGGQTALLADAGVEVCALAGLGRLTTLAPNLGIELGPMLAPDCLATFLADAGKKVAAILGSYRFATASRLGGAGHWAALAGFPGWCFCHRDFSSIHV